MKPSVTIPSASPVVRFFAWVTDTCVLAYLAWTIALLIGQAGRAPGDEGLPPIPSWLPLALLISAPILALAWGQLTTTLGHRLLALVRHPGSGRQPLIPLSALATTMREPRAPWWKRSTRLVAIVGFLLTFCVGFTLAEIRITTLFEAQRLSLLGQFVRSFFDPNWEILRPAVEKMIETIYLALMATLFAVPVAGILSFFAARNIMPDHALGNLAYYASRALFTIVRSTEPIIWAVIFCAWVGIGPFAGTMALFVHSVAALVKLYSEAIENVDPGPTEALRAVGAGPIAVVVRAVFPQVVPPFVAFTMYRWDINVRMATILGMVGAGGIGSMLLENSRLLNWSSVAVIILCITLVVLAMDLASAGIRQRIR